MVLADVYAERNDVDIDDLAIVGRNISFTSEWLTPNWCYNVIIKASNIVGCNTSYAKISKQIIQFYCSW